MKLFVISLALLFAVTLAGCGSSQASLAPSRTQNPVSNTQQKNPPIVVLPLSTDDLPQLNASESPATISTLPPDDQFISLAKQDLAHRLNIDIGQISLLKINDITWSDISLGCDPVPGQILTQGSATGYQIWLEAQEQDYIYHAGLNGQLVLCQNMNPGANNPLLFKTLGPTQKPPDSSP